MCYWHLNSVALCICWIVLCDVVPVLLFLLLLLLLLCLLAEFLFVILNASVLTLYFEVNWNIV